MAHIRQRGGSWGVSIRRLGYEAHKSFKTREEAERWARIEEQAILYANRRKKRRSQIMEDQIEIASSADVVMSSFPFHGGPGVYILIDHDRITYVGQGRNAFSRVIQHHKVGRRFTHYLIVPCETNRLIEVERKLISQFAPTENRYLPQERPKSLKSRAGSSGEFLSGGRSDAASIPLLEYAAERNGTQNASECPSAVPRSVPCPLTRSAASTGESRSG